MTAQQVRRQPKGTPSGGQFAPKPFAAAASVTAPDNTREWDVMLRRGYGRGRRHPPMRAASVRADGAHGALEAARAVLAASSSWTPHPDRPKVDVQHDSTGRKWHTAKLANAASVSVSPVDCRAADFKPFTSTAGGFKAKIRYQTDDGWGYTAGEKRTNLANCPATNIIAQTERQKMLLGRVCADMLNEGRITRAELPKFHGALIRSAANPYHAPTPTGDPDTLLSAYARAGCAAQIAALLPGNEYDPSMWSQNFRPSIKNYKITKTEARKSGKGFKPTQTRNTSGLPLPDAWRGFAPYPSTLLEAVKAAPPCSTPADGTLLGSVHRRQGADPDLDCLGAWAAETVQAQRHLFVYGLGCSGELDDGHALGLKRLPLSIISTSPETLEHGKKRGLRGRIPCGTVETLLFMPPAEEGTEPDSLEYARVQVAAARRSELAAHLAVGGLRPAHHSVVDALLDDPRSEWCATETEFRRKIVTAAVSQTAGRGYLNFLADRLIAEHVIGDPSEDVTEMELRCLRTALNRRAHLAMHKGMHCLWPTLYDARTKSKASYRSGYDANAGVGKLAGGAAVAFDSEFPLPETAERVTGRLGAYTRAVNRLRKQDAEGASAGRLFLQTLLTLPGLPFKERAKMFAFERVVTSDLYRQSRLVAG